MTPPRRRRRLDRAELQRRLHAAGVDRRSFGLSGGLPNEQYVLERRERGWAVYYSERGRRTDERVFRTERAACRHLLRRLLDDESTRIR
ncbi:hypothetical protein NOMA109596_16705 [Nocardioides marinus]|jgi:hypothetical protein|uniref:Uncharacterized protein n=1 Tax=Nocardioides marinus TaxID=374514 RepID=A0A7Z0C482_9ACTN|nr:hypothetical protein [Nocardioides marinus]MBU2072929.1 hypothetical protein [Actinomycetota bacterium]NYI09821.1 hypothetical protein [Nocardioides marinus]